MKLRPFLQFDCTLVDGLANGYNEAKNILRYNSACFCREHYQLSESEQKCVLIANEELSIITALAGFGFSPCDYYNRVIFDENGGTCMMKCPAYISGTQVQYSVSPTERYRLSQTICRVCPLPLADKTHCLSGFEPISNCDYYNSDGSCNECQKMYVLGHETLHCISISAEEYALLSNQFTSCVEFARVDSKLTCILCDKFYILQENICVKSNTCEVTNGKGCKVCNIGAVEEGKCAEKCKESEYYDFEQEKCLDCMAGCRCLHSGCDSCHNGYYERGGICEKCLQHCSECTDGETCEKCDEFYHLSYDSKCFYFPNQLVPHCTKFEEELCSLCELGYYLFGNNCYQITDCVDYSAAGEKLTCLCGQHYYYEEYEIVENSIIGACKLCAEGQLRCVMKEGSLYVLERADCMDGYFAVDAAISELYSCRKCKQNCMKCDSDDSCILCSHSYTLSNGMCVNIANLLLACEEEEIIELECNCGSQTCDTGRICSNNRCECQTMHQLYQGKCVPLCSSDIITQCMCGELYCTDTCLNSQCGTTVCDGSCSLCTASKQCLLCNSERELKEGRCVLSKGQKETIDLIIVLVFLLLSLASLIVTCYFFMRKMRTEHEYKEQRNQEMREVTPELQDKPLAEMHRDLKNINNKSYLFNSEVGFKKM